MRGYAEIEALNPLSFSLDSLICLLFICPPQAFSFSYISSLVFSTSSTLCRLLFSSSLISYACWLSRYSLMTMLQSGRLRNRSIPGRGKWLLLFPKAVLTGCGAFLLFSSVGKRGVYLGVKWRRAWV